MVYLGADHGGFPLKEKIKLWLDSWNIAYKDLGADAIDPDDDYPDYAFRVAEVVVDQNAKGLLICRSAAGMVIAANKIKGIRAASAMHVPEAQHSRAHNDTNVLCLSGDWLSDDQAKEIIHAWLNTEFSGEERHARRLKKIEEREL